MDGRIIVFKERAGKPGGGKGLLIGENISFTLSTLMNMGIAYKEGDIETKEDEMVCYSIENHPMDSRIKVKTDGITDTLTSRCGTGGGNVPLVLASKDKKKFTIRKLTPTECARLQGFPDWWCDGIDRTDYKEWKMWGNGIALPCAADVIGRIVKAIRKEEEHDRD